MNPLMALQVNRELDKILENTISNNPDDKAAYEAVFEEICEVISLKNQMNLLHEAMEEKYKENIVYRDHSTMFHCIADLFHLYDSTGCAPIWLSRVVEGFLRDKVEAGNGL